MAMANITARNGVIALAVQMALRGKPLEEREARYKSIVQELLSANKVEPEDTHKDTDTDDSDASESSGNAVISASPSDGPLLGLSIEELFAHRAMAGLAVQLNCIPWLGGKDIRGTTSGCIFRESESIGPPKFGLFIEQNPTRSLLFYFTGGKWYVCKDQCLVKLKSIDKAVAILETDPPTGTSSFKSFLFTPCWKQALQQSHHNQQHAGERNSQTPQEDGQPLRNETAALEVELGRLGECEPYPVGSMSREHLGALQSWKKKAESVKTQYDTAVLSLLSTRKVAIQREERKVVEAVQSINETQSCEWFKHFIECQLSSKKKKVLQDEIGVIECHAESFRSNWDHQMERAVGRIRCLERLLVEEEEKPKNKSVESKEDRTDGLDTLSDPPRHLICPITLEVMRDPVVAADGQTYDRTAIEEYFQRFGRGRSSSRRTKTKPTSPITREAIASRALYPNSSVKRLILEWQEKIARAQKGQQQE